MRLRHLLHRGPSLIVWIVLLSLLLLVIPPGHALWMKTLGITGTVNMGSSNPLHGTVHIHPTSLQKRSQGNPITARIGLPEGFDVNEIDITTVQLCFDKNNNTIFDPGECVPADIKPALVDHIGIPCAIVKFERAKVIELVEHIPAPAEVEFTVKGHLASPPETTFEGQDTVKLVDPEPAPAPQPTEEPAETVEPTPEPTETVGPRPTEEPTQEPTQTPTPESTETVEPTPTEEPTQEPTDTSTDTPTPQG